VLAWKQPATRPAARPAARPVAHRPNHSLSHWSILSVNYHSVSLLVTDSHTQSTNRTLSEPAVVELGRVGHDGPKRNLVQTVEYHVECNSNLMTVRPWASTFLVPHFMPRDFTLLAQHFRPQASTLLAPHFRPWTSQLLAPLSSSVWLLPWA